MRGMAHCDDRATPPRCTGLPGDLLFRGDTHWPGCSCPFLTVTELEVVRGKPGASGLEAEGASLRADGFQVTGQVCSYDMTSSRSE